MKHSENIDDESIDKNLYVPKFPSRKKPSNLFEISKSTCSSQSTQFINEYKTMPNSCQKRDLEAQIIKSLVKEKCNGEKYLIQFQWACQYKSYLYDNGVRPGAIENQELREYIVVNELVWKFLVEEYTGGPQVLLKDHQKHDKRSKTIEPIYKSQPPEANIQKSIYEVQLIGFTNESYFCYMHAGLQCLLSFAELNYFFIKSIKQILKEYHSKKIHNILQFSKAYLELIEQIKDSQGPVKIHALKSLLINKFHPKTQHDCQELILYFLGQIEEEINQLNKEIKCRKMAYVNFVDQLCKIQSVNCCQSCKFTTQLIEPFMTLSLAITNSKTLEQCVEEFLKDETLKDYHCQKCHGACIRKVKLFEVPKILILHLKRFQYFPSAHKTTKQIQYPLDVLHIMNKAFRLKGVVVHSGNLTSGHYYNYSKRFHQWYQFNDDIVTSVNKREVMNQQAYVLFYLQNDQ